MKFFEKRGVALVVLMLAIAGAVFIGQSRKDGFIAKKPTELLDVQYQDWICDEAGLLNGQTEQLIRDYNDSWNSKYYAITAVASIDHLTGWDAEDYAANLGEKWGLGRNDMILLLVKDGDVIEKGCQLQEGALNPHDVLRIRGASAVHNYLIQEVLKVYRQQGVDINDKHIEVIVRQMCRKVRVTDSGSSDLIGGALANRLEVENINAELQKRIDAGEQGIKLVEYQQVLLGITKAALANESFLSAASFQETTRVLTEAAIKGKVDPLAGLKENVIIGKLIPAGTGLPEVREDLKRREEERDAEVAAELAAAARQ